MSKSLWPHGLMACQAPVAMGILQARTLEWVAMLSSRESSQPKIFESPELAGESLPLSHQRNPETFVPFN